MRFQKCKRCYSPWWENAKPKDKGDPSNKWANGAPTWLKEKSLGTATKEQSNTSQDITSIQNCLEILGEEESETRAGLQKKLEALKSQRPKEEEELESQKEIAVLMERQKTMETAMETLKKLGDSEEMVENLVGRMAALEAQIQEKTKKPTEERMRSLQDKRSHRLKILRALDTDIEKAEEHLASLKSKEEEHTTELRKINADLSKVMKELNIEDLPPPPRKEKVSKSGEANEGNILPKPNEAAGIINPEGTPPYPGGGNKRPAETPPEGGVTDDMEVTPPIGDGGGSGSKGGEPLPTNPGKAKTGKNKERAAPYEKANA